MPLLARLTKSTERHCKTLPNDETLRFLTVEEVKRLHALSLAKYGGGYDLREQGLLESAVSMPEQTFEGIFLHPTLGAKAAAYLFHLCQNHAFVDGNKRIGLIACEAFLRLNGFELTLTSPEAEAMTFEVAQGTLSKRDLTVLIEKSLRPLSAQE